MSQMEVASGFERRAQKRSQSLSQDTRILDVGRVAFLAPLLLSQVAAPGSQPV